MSDDPNKPKEVKNFNWHNHPVPEDPKKRCTVEGCPRPKAVSALYCRPHYYHFHRYGDPVGGRFYEPSGDACKVEKCSAPVRTRGYCRFHYSRIHVQGMEGPYITAPRTARGTIEKCTKIVALYKQGHTMHAIGKDLGVSRQRIFQLLKNARRLGLYDEQQSE